MTLIKQEKVEKDQRGEFDGVVEEDKALKTDGVELRGGEHEDEKERDEKDQSEHLDIDKIDDFLAKFDETYEDNIEKFKKELIASPDADIFAVKSCDKLISNRKKATDAVRKVREKLSNFRRKYPDIREEEISEKAKNDSSFRDELLDVEKSRQLAFGMIAHHEEMDLMFKQNKYRNVFVLSSIEINEETMTSSWSKNWDRIKGGAKWILGVAGLLWFIKDIYEWYTDESLSPNADNGEEPENFLLDGEKPFTQSLSFDQQNQLIDTLHQTAVEEKFNADYVIISFLSFSYIDRASQPYEWLDGERNNLLSQLKKISFKDFLDVLPIIAKYKPLNTSFEKVSMKSLSTLLVDAYVYSMS